MDQAVIDLATAAGQTIVNAMTSDGWSAVRDRVAGWFGRGDDRRTGDAVELLDDTRTEIDAGRMTQPAATARWQGRLETLLYDRAELRSELAALIEDLRQAAPNSPIQVGPHGIVAHGDHNINQTGSGHATVIGQVNQGRPFGGSPT